MLRRGSLQANDSRSAIVSAPEKLEPVVALRAGWDQALARVRAFASRDVVRQAFGTWLVTRIAFIVLTYYIGAMIIGGSPSADTLLHSWRAWDGNWYIQIAERGYDGIQPTAFFPLYPMLIHALTWILGASNSVLAGLIVSNLGSLLAFVAISLLAAHEYGAQAGPKAARVLAAYPLAFFLFAPYTEGFFIGFASLALLSVRRGEWGWVALWAFLAGLTRPTGVVLVPALLWEFGRQNGWWDRAFWRDGRWKQLFNIRLLTNLVLVGAAVPVAVGLFVVYTWIQTGHPLATFHSHDAFWNRHGAPLWQTLPQVIINGFTAPFASLDQSLILLDLATVFTVAIITLVQIRKQPVAFTLYTAGLLYLSLYAPVRDTPVLIYAAGRFMMAAIPVFLLLGKWTVRRPTLEMFFFSLGFLLQAIFAAMLISQFHSLVE
jgi:Mannosyltransferase (PIG-V)